MGVTDTDGRIRPSNDPLSAWSSFWPTLCWFPTRAERSARRPPPARRSAGREPCRPSASRTRRRPRLSAYRDALAGRRLTCRLRRPRLPRREPRRPEAPRACRSGSQRSRCARARADRRGARRRPVHAGAAVLLGRGSRMARGRRVRRHRRRVSDRQAPTICARSPHNSGAAARSR